jgi:hypothetical protein
MVHRFFDICRSFFVLDVRGFTLLLLSRSWEEKTRLD